MFKVMIVDDEPSVRKGLISFIEWDRLDCQVVSEACDGIEAIEKLHSCIPDIVITDIKMPEMDGIEFASFLYSNYSDIKVIILTGYADFSYAQSAIKYGVVDFILKPTPTEKVYEAVEKAKNHILIQRRNIEKIKQLEQQVNNGICEIKEKFIHDIIQGVVSDSSVILSKAKELSLNFTNFFLLAFELSSTLPHKEIKLEEQNRFASAIKKFLSLSFKNIRHYIQFLNNCFIYVILLFEHDDYSKCIHSIITSCDEVLRMTDNFMEFTVSIGISGLHKSILELVNAKDEAFKALANKFYCDNNVFIYSSAIKEQSQNERILINDDMNSIIEFVRSCNHTGAVSALKSMMHKLKTTKQPIDFIKNIGIILCSLCSKMLSNETIDLSSVVESTRDLFEKIIQSKSIESLSQILFEVVKLTAQKLNPTEINNNYAINKVMEYFRLNYKKNFSLQAVSNYVHMNGSYLSRLFKKETGETMTEALTRLRVEKAKELLLKHDTKAYEVASLVGIDDPAYFSYIFKKYTGYSPREFKQTQGILTNKSEP